MREPEQFLNLLNEVDWFTNAGRMESAEAIPVASWREAGIYICDELTWLNFKNTIARRQHRHWKALGLDEAPEFDLLQKLIKKFVRRTTFRSKDAELSPEQVSRRPSSCFSYHFNWDLWIAGCEFISQDLLQPLFFLPVLFDWYAKGHFPCGWKGKKIREDWDGNSVQDLPSGKLRVL